MLPKPEPTPQAQADTIVAGSSVCGDCYGSGEIIRADGAPTVCGECGGRGYLEGER